jgi:hypothetical protein
MNARGRNYSVKMELGTWRPDDKAEIARRFKALRQKSRMTQAQFCATSIGICRRKSPSRAHHLTPEERQDIARLAARARLKKKD